MRLVLILLLVLEPMEAASASGGPLGIDHRLHYDNSGIWKRADQNALLYATIVTVGAGAVALGDHDELGDTFWRSVDAMVVSGVSTQGRGLRCGHCRQQLPDRQAGRHGYQACAQDEVDDPAPGHGCARAARPCPARRGCFRRPGIRWPCA